MADKQLLILPEVFTPKEDLEIKNPILGSITAPDKWVGGDFEAYFTASKPADDDKSKKHPWLKQWEWAKARVVEWDLDGLPTNPNQINDDEVPFGVMSYIARSMNESMMSYMDDNLDERKKAIKFPTAENLQAGEFFAWEEAVRNLQDKENLQSNMIKSWVSGYVLVRDWGPFKKKMPSEDGLSVDLALVGAVNELVGEVMGQALDLGNWRRLPGGV